jgi:hypothetical protein
MAPFLHFCQIYSGAIQAIATVVLIGITSYYAVVTHRSLKVASRQREASLLPQVSIEYKYRGASFSASGATFSAEGHIFNGGIHPFTIGVDNDSAVPVGKKSLPRLTDRVVAGGTETIEGIVFESAHLTGDPERIATGKWKLEAFLHVYNALHTQGYEYPYDEQDGIRRLSEEWTGGFASVKMERYDGRNNYWF